MQPERGHKVPTLLYVEESADERRLLELVVQRANVAFNVVTLVGYYETIHYLNRQGHFEDRRKYPEPDLLLVNLQLASATGVDLAQWVRKQPAFVMLPMAILGDTDDPVEVQLCLDGGGGIFLRKPRTHADWERIVIVLQQCLASTPPNLEALWAITSPALVQRRLRGELRANLESRRRLVEHQREVSSQLEAIRVSQKEAKKKIPFRRKPAS
jgi:DNA-binding response OmpR family regulator